MPDQVFVEHCNEFELGIYKSLEMWTRNTEVFKQSLVGTYDMLSEYQDANEGVDWEDCDNEL